MKKFLIFLVALLCVVPMTSPDAYGDDEDEDPVPGTVLIDIDNHMQQTSVWCWAAVAEQIIEFSQGNSPPQCALVAAANGVPPVFCCNGPNPACVRTGSMDQLRTLLLAYGNRASYVVYPGRDPMPLYKHLVADHLVVLQVRTGTNSTHVVVLKGMRFTRDRGRLEAWIIVNDPMIFDMPPMLYSRMQGTIINALVIL